MEWLRSTVGIGSPQYSETQRQQQVARADLDRRRAAAATATPDQRLRLQIGKHQVEVDAADAEAADLHAEAAALLRSGQKARAQGKLNERAALIKRTEVTRGKLRNLQAQQTQISQANANVEQALLAEDGAAQLESAAGAMEALDLEDIVDRAAEASAQVGAHDDMLSQPMFSGSTTMVDPDAVDDELAAMEAAIAAEQLDSMPPAPTVTSPPHHEPVLRHEYSALEEEEK